MFESIPDQHLDEIRILSKLLGAQVTVHGLLLEPSGIRQQGYSEVNREGVERQTLLNVERAAKMSPGGVITFHSTSGIPETIERVYVKDKEGKLVEKERAVSVINPKEGRIATLRDVQERYFPQDGEKLSMDEQGRLKPQSFSPDNQLARINQESYIRNQS